ncbi:MAG: hypothetical protein U1F35_08190 [Steroidobacteraceae bacterium]
MVSFIGRNMIDSTRIRFLGTMLVCCIGMVACQKNRSHDADATSVATTDRQSPPAAAPGKYPAPEDEPPEKVVVAALEEEYGAMNDSGGMRVTSTATGNSAVIRPRLRSARKESCTRNARMPVVTYECTLIVKVSLMDDGSEPSESGARVDVYWDEDKGEWARGDGLKDVRRSSSEGR